MIAVDDKGAMGIQDAVELGTGTMALALGHGIKRETGGGGVGRVGGQSP